MPYSFFVNESEITGSLKETLETQTLETEKVIEIVYQPQAVFKVRAVTRCTSTIPGKIGFLFNYIIYHLGNRKHVQCTVFLSSSNSFLSRCHPLIGYAAHYVSCDR